ncbi:MAG: amidohydrolase family protein [Nanoarchaeota archaeon]
MKNIINIHSHLLNFDFVPDNFFKTRAPVREFLLKHNSTRWLGYIVSVFFRTKGFLTENFLRWKLTIWVARIITKILPGRKNDRVHELLAILKKDIDKVAEELIEEMKEANIVLTTPLMMDLELASFNQKPEIPYRYQVKLISDIALKYPWKIMPFIMFDPRRKSSAHLVKTSLEKMGFLGVKMYPPLGYDPNPFSFFNPEKVNDELKEVYEYCEKNYIPITTHCSKHGAYSGDLIHCRELARKFANPESWEQVLQKYPKLVINFAHFGGDDELLNLDNSNSWSNKIINLIKKYKNVYTDIAYNDKALKKETKQEYFKVLNKLMKDSVINKKILFGTDWLMTRHTWKEKEYVKEFEMFSESKKIMFENPLKFLFPQNKLPKRIKDFYKNKPIPKWMDFLN